MIRDRFTSDDESTEEQKEMVVRPGRRTKLDAAVDITIALLPYSFILGLGYVGLGLLGLVPLPTFGLKLTVMNLLIASGAITGFLTFSLASYLAIEWHRDVDYVHVVELDKTGKQIDQETMTPQRWRKMEVRDDAGRMPPTRKTKSGDTVYLCKEVNMAKNYVKPAGDIENAPVDDQIIASKSALETFVTLMETRARNYDKVRGNLPAIRETLASRNLTDMAVSMEQSEHGGEQVEHLFESIVSDYEAIESERDDQSAEQLMRSLGLDVNQMRNTESSGGENEQ
ncbi:hypothetical protein KU306_12160 [Haloferax larsenii]|uniref:Uncharacterized protein n=1 Tax=Haloferax larsenii TaxID=302484 RepID=A0ABY5RDX5_HALLR|nr:hypothetical protein [Haloferax larsenii]UVE49658.1 hypothetical protein KU306_12160 [Haloferax larsenii]